MLAFAERTLRPRIRPFVERYEFPTELVKGGSAELKTAWLGPLCRGETLASFGVTEPGGGSDVANIKTRAVQDGPDFVLTGSKLHAVLQLGIALGLLAPSVALQCKILGDIFLRLIRTAIAPLVFLCVAAGIVSAGDFRRVGKLGLVALVYFDVVSTAALALGLVAGHLLGVGQGTALPPPTTSPAVGRGALPNAADFILNIFPDNFVGAFIRGELLQVLVIALIFGAAILRLSRLRRASVERGLGVASDVLFEFIHIVMMLAPLGTFGAVASAVAASGTAVLLSLAYLVVSFYAVVIVVVLGLACAAAGLDIFRLLSFIREEIYLVLGTPRPRARCRDCWNAYRCLAALARPSGWCCRPATRSTWMARRSS